MGWREAAADSVQPSNHRRAQRSKLGPPKPPESATKRSGGTGRDVRQIDRDTAFPVGKIPLRLFEKFPRLRRLVLDDEGRPLLRARRPESNNQQAPVVLILGYQADQLTDSHSGQYHHNRLQRSGARSQ